MTSQGVAPLPCPYKRWYREKERRKKEAMGIRNKQIPHFFNKYACWSAALFI
jgi:hypothetical protein